jgi:predicted dinucleotide-binding enzyme
MSYAIVGFGKIGQALAHARKSIDVTVASRGPRIHLHCVRRRTQRHLNKSWP